MKRQDYLPRRTLMYLQTLSWQETFQLSSKVVVSAEQNDTLCNVSAITVTVARGEQERTSLKVRKSSQHGVTSNSGWESFEAPDWELLSENPKRWRGLSSEKKLTRSEMKCPLMQQYISYDVFYACPQSLCGLVFAVQLFFCWLITKCKWWEHAFKVLRTARDKVYYGGWNSF